MSNPVAIENLFGIESLDIRWYGIIIAIGIIVGAAVGVWQAKKRGYNTDMVIDLVLLCLPLCIICARAYYVAFEWDMYKDDFWSVFKIWEGGIAIYGAVIGGVIGALIFSKWKKVPLGDILDIAAPSLIIGQAIGRWGNFANQEAFGYAITDPNLQFFPFGVYIDRLQEWHYATFFYESMWNLIVFVVLIFYAKKAKHQGNVFVMYLTLYGLGRCFIEMLRTDSLWLIPGVIRISSLLGAIFFIAGAIYLILRHRQQTKRRLYEGRYSLGYQKPKKAAEENK